MMRVLREPMTIAQLKRHMDRRFDRLERVKANKSDLRRFATKRDLQRFATRRDLERFATKVDLERSATKVDLERFATKVDLERFATKLDLEQYATKRDLERFATKDDLAEYVARAESLAADTRGYFEVVADGLKDEVKKIGEVGDLKSLLTLHSAVLDEHERRITDLEHSRHQVT